MKKLFTAALLAVTIATSAFATDAKKVSSIVLSSFDADFSEASNVTWTAANEFTKATFILNKQKMEAFYSSNGELFAKSKGISLDELPVRAKRDFAKRFAGFTVKEAISMELPAESAFFISGENEKESVILKVSDAGTVSVYKRTSK